MSADSTADTVAHIKRVQEIMEAMQGRLEDRAERHDLSKLQEPEKSAFDRLMDLSLSGMTYGSEEYKACLRAEKPAIQHHYEHNSHHPEHEACSEDWRDVSGYSGLYQISSLGRIRSVMRVVERTGEQGDLTVNEMIRKAHITPKGYARVQLSKNGTPRNHMVHVLVAEAFIGPAPSERHEVNHKSGVKTNNRLGNLEWATPCENLQHAYDTGLREPSVKYTFVCESLGLSTLGAVKMADECRKLGYEKVAPAGVWRSAMEGGYHHDLSFDACPLVGEVPYSGVDGMTLLDLLEMFCDWKAAGERHSDSSMEKSIKHNKDRFQMSEQLVNILENSRKEMGWK